MTTYALTAYLKYKRKAIGRHGTHSPFVYDLADNALLKKIAYKEDDATLQPILQQQFLPHYKDVICKIALHYGCKNIVCINDAATPLQAPSQTATDLLWISTGDEKKWQQIFVDRLSSLNDNSIVILSGIHTTATHTAAWQQLCDRTSVRMSIDLYGIGMLLFRKEFKIKQSFVLKTR